MDRPLPRCHLSLETQATSSALLDLQRGTTNGLRRYKGGAEGEGALDSRGSDGSIILVPTWEVCYETISRFNLILICCHQDSKHT